MKNIFWNLTALLIFIAVVFFLIVPVTMVFKGSLQTNEGGPLTLKNYHKFASYRTYWMSLFNSVTVSLAASLIIIILAVPLSFLVARYNIPGKAWLISLSTIPLMVPSFIAAFSWVLLLGRAGILTPLVRALGIPFESIYGHGGVIAIFAMQIFPYVFLMTLSGFSAVDESLEEASKSLGTSPLNTFLKISVPLVLPSILSGAIY